MDGPRNIENRAVGDIFFSGLWRWGAMKRTPFNCPRISGFQLSPGWWYTMVNILLMVVNINGYYMVNDG